MSRNEALALFRVITFELHSRPYECELIHGPIKKDSIVILRTGWESKLEAVQGLPHGFLPGCLNSRRIF